MNIVFGAHEPQSPAFEIGQWVQSATISGHNVMGFITHIDALDGTVQIQVCHACCERAQTIEWANTYQTCAMPDMKASEVEGYLLFAIEMALMVGDKEDFMKLTGDLRKINQFKRMPKPIVARGQHY